MEKFSIILGKTVQKITKLRGNGGSALPGLVVERSNPQFLKKTLGRLPRGVVVISGTNGKTTTTKIVSELLEKQGLKVFTNKSGSNFVRGVISAILGDIKLNGSFDYDIAVLELDEAHAVKFCEVCPIDYSLILNVQRDQLDRFGEIDHTAELLQKVAKQTRQTCVLNREDPRVQKLTAKNTVFFGLSSKLQDAFPSDDDLLSKTSKNKAKAPAATVCLQSLDGQTAVYKINQKDYRCQLALKGIYNAFNAAGALALCHSILPKAPASTLIEQLGGITSAFGRGESLHFGDQTIELLLVKNPSAFQLSLTSFADKDHDYMIAINDKVADGRDVSWLWNVDFLRLPRVKVASGSRATDMALRLKYDEIDVDTVEEDLATALKIFSASSDRPKRIFATYTAMLEIRKIISGKSIL